MGANVGTPIYWMRGQWYKIECYFVVHTSNTEGRILVWIDDTLQFNYTKRTIRADADPVGFVRLQNAWWSAVYGTGQVQYKDLIELGPGLPPGKSLPP
jgi:hypothetical protein